MNDAANTAAASAKPYLTTVQRAAAIREQLKAELKAGRNEVSVKASSSSMSGSLRVVVLTNSVSLCDVKRICAPFEDVRRDERSGEILMGGNTYLTVEYSAEALAPVVESITRWLDTGSTEFRGCSVIEFAPLGGGSSMWRVACDGVADQRFYDRARAIRAVAELLLDGHGDGWGRAAQAKIEADTAAAQVSL